MKSICVALTISLTFGSLLCGAPVQQPPVSDPPPAAAMPEPRDQARDISGELDAIIAKHKIPGMVAMAIEGDRVIVTGVAGVRRAGSPEKITIDDQMHLGSCTKAMTATVCAMLVERGKLKWSTTFAEAFPDLAPTMPEAWKPVTLEQLLTNTGGVPADLHKNGLWSQLWTKQSPGHATRRALLEGVLKYQPIAKPGEKYEYANGGFAIAGHMAETAAAKDYEEIIVHELMYPLRALSIGFGAPGVPGAVTQPRGHTAEGKPVEPGPNADNPPAITPAGRVYLNIGDWAKFISFHLRGERGEPDTVKLLKPETVKKLHTPSAVPGANYAMGWTVSTRPWAKGDQPGDNGRVLNHNGSNTMWYCVTWLAPEKNFAVLVCCNQGNGAAACDEACGALIKAWREREAAKPAEKPNPKP